MESITIWFSNILERYYDALIPEKRYLAYLNGLKITIEISLLAVLIGVLIGIIIAVIKVSAPSYNGKKWASNLLRVGEKICNLYVTIIRGTPVMLQLLIIYNLIFTARNTNEVLVGAICFGINSGAYVAEIVRAGIESVDKGQNEAGRTLGFNYIQTMTYIVMPQAVRNILPALGNEFIALIKETSVASVIAVTDILKASQYVGSRTYDILPPLIIAACFYLVMVIGLSKLLEKFGRRLGENDRN